MKRQIHQIELPPTPDIPGAEAPTPRRMDVPGFDAPVSMEMAFKDAFGDKTIKKSADRLRRVMNMPKDGSNSSSASSAIDVDHDGVVVQANLDPMLALVHADPFVTIAIIVPMSFTGGDGTTGLLELPIEELDEALCTVHGQVLVLKKVDSSTVAANAGSFCGIVTVSGSVTSVVNPVTAAVPDGTSTFSFDIGTLQMAAAVRWEQLKMSSDSTPTLLPVPKSMTGLPYTSSDDNDEAIFIVSGTEAAALPCSAAVARRRTAMNAYLLAPSTDATNRGQSRR